MRLSLGFWKEYDLKRSTNLSLLSNSYGHSKLKIIEAHSISIEESYNLQTEKKSIIFIHFMPSIIF